MEVACCDDVGLVLLAGVFRRYKGPMFISYHVAKTCLQTLPSGEAKANLVVKRGSVRCSRRGPFTPGGVLALSTMLKIHKRWKRP